MKFILLFLLVPLTSFSQLRTDTQREKEVKAYLDSAIKSKDPIEIAEAYYRLGKVENRKLDLLKSNKNLLKAISILEEFGPTYELGRNYYWLAINARQMRDKVETFKNLDKAFDIYNICNSSRGKMLIYNMLSNIYEDSLPSMNDRDIFETDYKKALHYADLSLKYAILEDDTSLIEDNKKLINRLRKMVDGDFSSLHPIEMNMHYLEKTNLHDYITYSLDYSRHLLKQKQFSKAWKKLTEVDSLIKKYTLGNQKNLMHLEKAFADYYTETKDLSKAINHLKNFHEYQIKVLQDDRQGAISQLHISHETEKKVAALKLKDQDLLASKRLLWISGGFLTLSMGLSFFLFRLNKKNTAISKKNALLVREQNHRVKNNLQIVSSLLNLQSLTLDNPKTKAAIDETQLRIASMIHLHRQLYDNESINKICMSTFLLEITEDVLNTYDLNHVLIKAENLEAIELDADKAMLLGLITNELVTNACKYAFPNHPQPILHISLSETPNKRLEMAIRDNGLQKVTIKEQSSNSFGYKLISMLVLQLNAISSYQYHEGLEFRLQSSI